MSGRFTERMLPQVVSQLWDLKENGRTGEEIAALLGWKKTAVFDHIQEHGGIRPRWGRNLKGRSLLFTERQEIMIWHSHQLSVREIGRRLGRSHSTISRELRRNVMPHNSYRATTAHRIAFDAARRARPGKLFSSKPECACAPWSTPMNISRMSFRSTDACSPPCATVTSMKQKKRSTNTTRQ